MKGINTSPWERNIGRLDGRFAIVTGGARGMGLHCTQTDMRMKMTLIHRWMS
jgi:hypothetical protein